MSLSLAASAVWFLAGAVFGYLVRELLSWLWEYATEPADPDLVEAVRRDQELDPSDVPYPIRRHRPMIVDE